MMTGLRCRRLDPRHGEVGEPLVIRYALTNRNRLFPVLNVHVEEMADSGRSTWQRLMGPSRAWVMHIGPRETLHGEAVFWPTARGEARFDRVRIWTTFPFGIIKKSVTFTQPQHTLIYPMRYELRRRVLKAFSQQSVLGLTVSQHAGAGDDYYGMREYRPGDSMRHIAWKRSACRGSLICIERSRVSPARLRVALNLATPPDELQAAGGAGSARSLEERAISLAASLVYTADAAGFAVGLTIVGMRHEEIQVRRGQWHLHKILAALAAIDLDADRIATMAAPDLASRAQQVVVHPLRVDPAVGDPDAWHLTAAQLERLAVRPVGWEPPSVRTDGAATREAAA